MINFSSKRYLPDKTYGYFPSAVPVAVLAATTGGIEQVSSGLVNLVGGNRRRLGRTGPRWGLLLLLTDPRISS